MNDDKTLVSNILNGDTESFGKLVKAHYPKLLGFLRKMGLDRENAKSLAGEIFSKAYRNLPRYDDSRNFTAWLYKITAASAKDCMRRNADGMAPSGDLPEFLPAPDADSENDPGFNSLNRLLSAIHDDDRSMLVMHYYNKLPLREIGRIYGLSAESVRMVTNKARILILRAQSRSDRAKCRYNEDFIIKYRTGGLETEDKSEFENHLETCGQCREMLERDSNLVSLIKSETPAEDIPVESIMNRIDRNAYIGRKSGIWEYLSASGHAKKLWRIVVPAFFAILIAVSPAVPEISKPVWGGVLTLFNNQELIVNAETGEDYRQPVTLTSASGLAIGSNLTRMLNESGTGVVPWQVLYADPNRMFIWNGTYMVGYRDGEIFQAADLGGLCLSNRQDSALTQFSFSATGDFFIAGKNPGDENPAEENPGTYLFDTTDGKYLKLSASYFNQTVFAWSSGGNYLAYADKKAGSEVCVLDLKNMNQSKYTVSFPVKSLFVSNTGSVSAFTGDAVMTASTGDNTWRTEAFQYEPFYIDCDTGTIWYISNGAIAKHVAGGETDVALMPEPQAGSGAPSDTFITSWRITGNFLACRLKNGDAGLMNLQTGNFSYMDTNREIASEDLPWCDATPQGRRLMFDNGGKFLISSGNDVTTVNIPGYAALTPSGTRWMDDDRIAYVRMVDEKSPKEGEFSLYTINTETGDIVEVFRSVAAEPVLNTSAPGSSEGVTTKPGNSDASDKLYETDKASGSRVESLVLKACKVKSGPGDSYADIGKIAANEVIIYNSRVVNGWCLAQKLSGMLDFYDKTRNAFWIKADNILLYDKSSLPVGSITADGVNVSRVSLVKGDLIRIILKGDSQSYVTPDTTDVNMGITGWIDNSSFTQDVPGSGNSPGSSGSAEAEVDLNGDGVVDAISFNTDGQHYSLCVNDAYAEGDGTGVQAKIRFVDVSSGDGFIEMVVEENGPGDNNLSTFFYYDGQRITRMGQVQGLCGNSDAVAGNGIVLSKMPGNILETWYYQSEYLLNAQHLLVESPRDFRQKIGYKDSAPLKLLIPELPFTADSGGDSLAFVLKQNETVWFVGSDAQGNCLFETPDGRRGWLKINGFQDIPLAGITAGEAFEGLNTAH